MIFSECLRVWFLLTQGLPLRPGRALPFVKGRKEAKAFQRTPLESVWGTVLVSANESYWKGAPMKMPTLLAAANQKLSAFVRRRAFSERSRWLAVGLPDGSSGLPIYRWCSTAQRFLVPFVR